MFSRFRFAVLTAVATLVLAVPIAYFPGPALLKADDVGYCDVYLDTYNRNRHVFGYVDAECTWGCPPLEHTHPFGNWGVDSNTSSRGNATQFKGWKSGQNPYCTSESIPSWRPEWNSCTPANLYDPRYYNWAGETEQVSFDEQHYGTQVRSLQTTASAGCGAFDGWTQTLTGNFLDLYELDWDGDDYVDTISIPDVTVTLSCDSSQCYSTYSNWAYGAGADAATEIRVHASGYYRDAGGGGPF